MKKATSAVLIFMILLTLTACGQKSSTAENESKAASGTTEKTAIEDSAGPASETTAKAAADWEYLAMKETNVTEEGEQTTYLDGSGNPIAEDDYNSIVETRFAGMEPSEFKPEWKAVKAAAQ